MGRKVIIADTSCLIVYEKINQLEILRRIFTELIVSKEVADEFLKLPSKLPSWIEVREITNTKRFYQLCNDLDKGEASSITLALETGNSF